MILSKVAVIMTSYNGDKYIHQQLDSLLNQKDVNVDIYIYDDGSTDDTEKIIKDYKKKYANIFLKKNEKNSGGTGKNILLNIRDFSGIKVKNYSHFALCDQDDIWKENKLIRSIKALLANESDLYYSNLSMWNPEHGIYGTIKKDFPLKEYDYLFEGGSAGCTYVFSSHLLDNLQRWLKNYPIESKKRISHDWLIYFLARLNKVKIVHDSHSEILYRIHDNNQYGNISKLSIVAIRKKIDFIRNGFLHTQIRNNIFFLDAASEEYKIYNLYLKSLISRLYVLLRFNFKLIKSKKKFFYFLILSIFFVKSKSIEKLKGEMF